MLQNSNENLYFFMLFYGKFSAINIFFTLIITQKNFYSTVWKFT